MERDSFRSWTTIVLFGMALTVSSMDRMLLSIAAPAITAEQKLSGTALGMLLSSFAWTYTAFQLPSGLIVDRYGPRRVLSIAFIGWSVACATTGFGGGFLYLLLCRLALGLFEAPLYAVAHSLMGTAFSERRRGLATAIYTKGVSLGPALGAIIGSYLLVSFGYSEMFVIVGMASLIFVVPWLMVVPSSVDAPRSMRPTVDLRTSWKLLTNRTVLGLSLGYFGFLYLFFIYTTWLPTYLAKARGMTTAQIAWLTSVPFLISLLAGPVSGWLADWLIGRGFSTTLVRKSAIAVGLTLGAAVIPAAFAADPRVAAVFFVVALAGQAISATNMLALPSAVAPKGFAGLIGSAQQMMGAIGGIVSPIVTGILYDKTQDFKAAIVVAGAMLAMAAICFLVVIRRIEPIRLEPRNEDQVSSDEKLEGLQTQS